MPRNGVFYYRFVAGRLSLNNQDPSISLPDDQVVQANNVEFVDSMLGERRLGTSAITLPAFLSGKDRVPLLIRHTPTQDEKDAELWVLAVTGTTTASLGRKTSTWQTEVTISDTPTLTGFYQYQWQAITLHGKLFFTYKSNVNRAHVWDGTVMRRAGHAAPSAAPTSADDGAGAFTTTRYYRVRYATLSGSTVQVRSEPSAVRTHVPSGTGSGVIITKPASISENETHWELEASTDNSNFYRVATTVVATTTYTDTAASYTSNTLSEALTDYALIPSARYLTSDEDRLVWAGSFDTDSQASRVGWTPVFGASGVGNDERFATTTDPFNDLDTYHGGPITGLSEPVLGGIWVFKFHAVHKMTRTGFVNKAYDIDQYTDAFGALEGSVVTGVDETGEACVYFIDNEQGPCRIGVGGIKRCGDDVRNSWKSMNLEATKVVCRSLFYPKKRQVIWCIAEAAQNTPTLGIVLHVDKSRPFADGVRKGWVTWGGNRSKAISMCLFSDNIEDNADRSDTLVPFIGLEALGLVHRCDTTNTDNAVAYTATITTKPYIFKSILQTFSVGVAAILAKAVAAAQITVKLIKNTDATNEVTATSTDVSLAATAAETDVIKVLDALTGAEMHMAQIQFTDPTTVSAQWRVDHFAMREEKGQEF